MDSDKSNKLKAEEYIKEYEEWKTQAFQEYGFFPIFMPFKDKNILSKISGGGLKLYIFLGLYSGNFSGETWVSMETIMKYFKKSERTITNWITDLKKLKLIERMQMELNGVSHTYLRPYGEARVTNVEK